jgi:hypothetical protein
MRCAFFVTVTFRSFAASSFAKDPGKKQEESCDRGCRMKRPTRSASEALGDFALAHASGWRSFAEIRISAMPAATALLPTQA